MISWRFSLKTSLSHLRGFEVRQRSCWLRWRHEQLPCPPNSRICWLLLGTLPKLILTSDGMGKGSPGSWGLRGAPRNASDEVALAASIAPAGLLKGLFQNLAFGLRMCYRACVLLVRFTPLLLFYPLTYALPSFSCLWLKWLLTATESSGPTYIKLGQWASTRRDLFSEEFCTLFSRLHVRVAPHPWAHTRALLQKVFGEEWGKALLFEGQEPVGSGCVAQVYKAYVDTAFLDRACFQKLVEASRGSASFEAWEVARLGRLLGYCWKEQKPKGMFTDQAFLEDLLLPMSYLTSSKQGSSFTSSADCQPGPKHLIPAAIKVLHPGLLSQVQVDLVLMKTGSQILGLIPGIKWLSLTEIVEEFEKLMVQQIDLRYEAQNLECFQNNFLDVKFVRFPTPLQPFVTKDVLVETFERGGGVSVIWAPQQSGAPLVVACRLCNKLCFSLQLQVSNLLSSVFKLLMTHKVKLESNFASIIFAIMVLEGLGRSLDPKLDILEAAKPFLIKSSPLPAWLQW
ncbi:uncharacterized aarF domain-containing protein kinase 2 [Gracilinanus agilis]|uniref:uncharacterized aarF domain-containing protein kinase 2 n=1 Tax=Gracilinanus agilis TaxID=191870 RepID=UPI001CFF33F7|nr:uncharacterized aarF domain-containing protein kinase 2 [Gracilinanus agilis]